MPDEHESPSAGWQTVYAEMDAPTDIEPETGADADTGPRVCPDCGTDSPWLHDGLYRCPEHGVWSVDGPAEEPDEDRPGDGERGRLSPAGPGRR